MTADSDERIGIDGEPPEGQNSASLVDGRIVVDPGPPTDTAWTDLRIGLERAGVSLERLERHTRGNDSAPATPWDLAVDPFGELEAVHVTFGVGEAAAHGRRLERTGDVERVADDPVSYERTDRGCSGSPHR